MPLAYSYKRFSSTVQRHGHSLQRQIDLAEQYCLENGLTLSADSFDDLGVSGFTGANLAEGSGLSRFLKAVETGRIQTGSFLLIEAFDRLTRMGPTDALQLVMKVLSAGIIVVTLQDRRSYSAESLSSDVGSLMMSVMSLFSGHDESRRKSERLSAVYQKKRTTQDNRIKLPFWISRDESGSLVLDEQNAAIVRQIFEWAVDGLGARAIARLLNDRNAPAPRGHHWSNSTVNRIISSRATIGEYQPHTAARGAPRTPIGSPIEGFYPAVIDTALFVRANRTTRATGPKLTELGPRNLFTGLLQCSCGANFHFKRSSARDNTDRLICSQRCGEPSIPYEHFEAVTVFDFVELLYEQIDIPQTNSKSDNDKLVDQKADIDLKIGRIVSAIEEGANIPQLVKRLSDLRIQRDQLDAAFEDAALNDGEEEDTHLWFATAGQDYLFRREDRAYRQSLAAVVRRYVESAELIDKDGKRYFRWKIANRYWSKLIERPKTENLNDDDRTIDIPIAFDDGK